MTDRTCTFNGCDRAIDARGLCQAHWKQDRAGKTLQPLRGSLIRTLGVEEYFRQQVERGTDGECWPWRGPLTKAGYGRLPINKIDVLAHRRAYEIAKGPIPDGLHIDHVCHDLDPDCPGGRCKHRACCNPAHLEAVTKRTNDRRGKSIWAVNRRKTHCIHGHQFTVENTYRAPNGTRSCRRCHADAENARFHAGKRR